MLQLSQSYLAVEERVAGDDLVEQRELDWAVVGGEGEEVGLRHDHLRPADDPHRHHREPDALENGS